jgi:peptidoglycan/xylan/chitin deacetylase (PgdA/CDA1 family)
MPRKKKSVSRYRSLTYRHKIALICGLLVSCYLIYLYFPYYLFASHRNVPETKQNVQKVIPKEVKSAHLQATTSASFRIPILMYHYVEYVKDRKDLTRQSLDIEPAIFDEQIKSLVDAHFTFLTMADVGDIIDGNKELPSQPVVLTFDDGYRDFYTDAYPILRKYNVKATAYVVPGFFDQPNYMLTSQIKILAKDDNIELGAHTMHHVWLKDMTSFLAEREISQSKYKLEDLIHKPVVSFAYPYGAFDNSAIDLAKKAGFVTAVSTIGGIEASKNNRYFLYRIRPGYMTGPVLTNYVINPPFASNP